MAGRLESCPSVRAALQIGSSNMWTSIGSPKAKFKGYIVTTLAMGITQLMTKLTLIRQPMRVLKFYHLCDHSINNNNPTIQPYEYHYLPSTNLFNKTNLTIQQFEDHRLPSTNPFNNTNLAMQQYYYECHYLPNTGLFDNANLAMRQYEDRYVPCVSPVDVDYDL